MHIAEVQRRDFAQRVYIFDCVGFALIRPVEVLERKGRNEVNIVPKPAFMRRHQDLVNEGVKRGIE